MLIRPMSFSLYVLSLTVLSLWIRESSLRKVLLKNSFQSSKDTAGSRVLNVFDFSQFAPICNPLFSKNIIF